jgi:hypothetical protein
MKNIKYVFATLILGLGLSSCGDSFLTQYPEGGVLLEDQYAKLPDNLKGSILGIYSKLYEYGGHDTFGERSIDMYTDIQSGDMAMSSSSYGWFETYERGYFYAYARSYLWSYYYEIIHLANIGIVAVEANIPAIMAAIAESSTPDDVVKLQGYYYGQLLTLRGWAYANLLNYYCDPMDQLEKTMDTEKAIPVYTEKEVKAETKGQPLSTVEEVYNRVYEDLNDGISVLDYYSKYNTRNSKLEVNADIARLMLAYAMLNHGNKENTIIADGKNAWQIALEQAKAVIDGGKYPMLKNADLLTTGFGDVNASNWLWGQDVTVETTTALGSFFGQVDIHSYSYAAAGDTKAIDSKLYDDIVNTGWDARVGWFIPGSEKFAYCPHRKFYNISTKDETDLKKVDRNWLNDNVFMRVELAYLIAAEAAYDLNDETTAKAYLQALCDERVLEGQESLYSTWLGTLTGDALKEAIIYNWRVEMWGEGYSMQLLRRLQKTRTLGTNHLDRGEKDLTVTNDTYEQYQCQIPSSETRYNPSLTSKTTLTEK